MRVGILGINHKLADLKLRERFAIACQKRFHALSEMQEEHPFILLSTCNRTEIYFSSSDLAETHSQFLQILKEEIQEDFEQKLYSFFTQDCFLHLTKVATGLDSAIFAETEIQGQVKNAYEHASKQRKLPFALHFLFQKSLKIAKDLRTNFLSERGMQDLEQAVFQTGAKLFRKGHKPSILFVGGSEINLKVLDYLHKKDYGNISLCNRTQERGEMLSAKFSIPLLPWQELHRWHEFDWVILGTKAQEYLIRETCLQNPFAERKLLIDLALPRNADPEIAKDPRIQLLNIDEINGMVNLGRKKVNEQMQKADHLLSQEVMKQAELYQAKNAKRNPLFAA
jgi:glutamyl-tRNA reductase